MRRFFTYLACQLKRVAKGSVAVLVLCAILTGCLIVLCREMTREQEAEAASFDLEIGIVGNMEDTMLQIGVYALQNLDASSFYVKFTPMSEDEAESRLKAGELSGYVYIPDSFVEDVMSFKVTPLTFYFHSNPTSLGPKLVHRMVEIIASYISECQCGVYGTEYYGLELDEYFDYNRVDALNIKYISFLITRDNAFDVNVVKSPDELSVPAYYVCAISVLLIMLIGITAAPIFAAKKMSLPRLLKANGMGSVRQILSEYISFTLLLFVASSIMMLGVGAYVTGAHINLDGLFIADMGDVVALTLKLFPVCMTVGAMQLLLYELTDNLLNAVVLQFTVALSLGYISGCFYPSYFFPESVQTLSALLPVGACMNYLSDFFLPRTGATVLPLAWTAALLALTCAVRRANLKGGRP